MTKTVLGKHLLPAVAIAAAACFALSSCSSREFCTEPAEYACVPMSFEVNRAAPSTRAVMDGISVLCTAGEKISILDGEYVSAEVNHNNSFTAASGGSRSTLFEGECRKADCYYAVSPYFAAQTITNSNTGVEFNLNTLASGVITTMLPHRQKACPGTFDPEALVMVGKTASGDSRSIDMKQLCGLIRFTIDGTDVREVEFKGNNGEKLSGPVAVTFDTDGNPVLAADDSRCVSGFAKELFLGHVCLVPSEGESIAPGTYYLCLPPTSFTKGVTFRFRKTDGSISEKIDYTAINLTRAGLFDFGTVDSSVTGSWQAVDMPFYQYPRQGVIKFPLSTASAKESAPVNNGWYSITKWPDSTKSAKWEAGTEWAAQWLNKNVSVDVTDVPWAPGGKYTFILYATSYISPHSINGMRMSGSPQIILPGLAGKRLARVDVTAGNSTSPSIVDGSGNIIPGGEAKSLAIGGEYSFVLGSTGTGEKYAITASSLSLRTVTLYFSDAESGDPVSVASAVTRTGADSFSESGTHALLKGAFTVKDGTKVYSGAAEYGFEYKGPDETEWKSVTCGTDLTMLETVTKSGVKYYVYSCEVDDLVSGKENSYRAWAKGNDDAGRTYGDARTVYASDKVLTIYFADYVAASDNWLSSLVTVNSKNSSGQYFNVMTDFDSNFDSAYTFSFHGDCGLSKSTNGGGLRTNAIIFSPKSTSLSPEIGGTYNGYVKIPGIAGKSLSKVTVYSSSANYAAYRVTSDAAGENSLTGEAQLLASSPMELVPEGCQAGPSCYLQVIPQTGCSNVNVSQLRFQYE